MSEGSPKGFFAAQSSGRHAWGGRSVRLDAPLPAWQLFGMPCPTHCRWLRRAAPRSHPFPRLTLVLCVQVVTRRLGSVRPALGSLDTRPQRQPAAAGMQARTPTSLLHPSITLLIPPLPCPIWANLPDFRLPQPPRACAVPLWHPDARSSVTAPPALRRKVMCRVTLALPRPRRHPHWRVRDVSHPRDNRLLPYCE